jgi:hypothetical protein
MLIIKHQNHFTNGLRSIFLTVVTGWPGFVHDAKVLQDTLVTYGDRFPILPKV